MRGSTEDSHSISMAANADISYAEELLNMLKSAQADHAHIVLDGSAVERITTPCLQIMLAAAKAAQDNNGSVTLSNPPSAITQACMDLGLDITLLTKDAA